MSLPPELIPQLFVGLKVQDMLNMRGVNRAYKTQIDNDPELQIKITDLYLQKIQPKLNIPWNHLKWVLDSRTLAVEIHGSLSIFKLAQAPRALYWINQLILKEGKPHELTQLFIQLQSSNQLRTLHLWKCELDESSQEALKLLQTQTFIQTENNDGCSLEKLIPSDASGLKEFDQEVQNESSSGELVLKQFEKMNPLIRDGIITSIWYSTLMSADAAQHSKDLIQQKVYMFVSKNPHHAAIRAAIENFERNEK